MAGSIEATNNVSRLRSFAFGCSLAETARVETYVERDRTLRPVPQRRCIRPFSPSTDGVSTAVAVPYVSRHGKPPCPTPPLQRRPMATPRNFPPSPLYLLAFGTCGCATRDTSLLLPLGSSLLRPVARAKRRLPRWERHLGRRQRQQAPTLQPRRPSRAKRPRRLRVAAWFGRDHRCGRGSDGQVQRRPGWRRRH